MSAPQGWSWIRVILVLASICYPFLLYFGSAYVNPAVLVCVLGGLLALRYLTAPSILRGDDWVLQAVVFAVFIVYTIWVIVSNNPRAALYYPVVANLSVLFFFFRTLLIPPSFIERIARTRNMEISPQGIPYMRKLTMIWCLLFVANALGAFATATWANREIWLLFNGLISYCLMAILFLGEMFYRPIYKRRIAQESR